MEILILVRDRELDKIYQYSSGTPDTDLFTVEEAYNQFKRLQGLGGRIKAYNDTHYDQLEILYNRLNDACSILPELEKPLKVNMPQSLDDHQKEFEIPTDLVTKKQKTEESTPNVYALKTTISMENLVSHTEN